MMEIFPIYPNRFENLRIYLNKKDKYNPYSAVIGHPSNYTPPEGIMGSNFVGYGKTREEAIKSLAKEIYNTHENFADYAPKKLKQNIK